MSESEEAPRLWAGLLQSIEKVCLAAGFLAHMGKNKVG